MRNITISINTFLWSVDISLRGQSVFKTYGTASFVSKEEVESGGAMRGKNKNPLVLSIRPPKIFHSPRPNLLTCGIEQHVYCTDLLPHTNAYRCSNQAHEFFIDRCFLDFVIVPQRLIFSWLQ